LNFSNILNNQQKTTISNNSSFVGFFSNLFERILFKYHGFSWE